MKKITEAASKVKFEIQDDTINYISAAELKKYLDVAGKFLSEETKEIVNWLIVNNDSYISDLSNDEDENALAGFYKAGVPKDEHLKELYKLIGLIVKSGRTLEIPVFQTKSQFESILNKTAAPDEIILDLKTEKGRAAVAKKYDALAHKIARQWVGKINLSYEDLLGCCYEGLAYAMNTYGKKNKKSKATDEEVKGYTFGQFAAYCMLNQIKGNGVNDSHLVRIPTSQQKKERDEKGHNTKNLSVSGDKAVGHDDDGGKTIFDFIGSANDTESGVNAADRKKLWDSIKKILSEQFDEKILDVWCSYWGLFDHKKLQNKEIAKKYNVANSNITYYCQKVNFFIKKNKKILDMFSELYELVKESINEKDREDEVIGKMVKYENISEED